MPRRDPLAALKFYDKEDRPWPGARLTSGAIVGHTTSTSARIWVRAWEPGTYCLIVAEREIDKAADPKPAGTRAVDLVSRSNGASKRLACRLHAAKIGYDTDLTHVFDVTGLAGGTRYHYAVFRKDGSRAEPWEVGRDEAHTFRTPPAAPERVTFGLYSCHMPFKGRSVHNMHMWESFHEALELAGAGFVIGGGDQAYSDGDPKVSIWEFLRSRKKELIKLPKADRIEVMHSWYRDIYRGYWGDVALRRVFRSFPQYMIWDDHEIMDGWGSYTPDELSNHLDTLWEWENKGRNLTLARSMGEAAKRAYFEYQHAHNPGTPAGQWDYTFDWSLGLRFFVLDMRGTRDYNRAANRILGLKQLGRLEAWLRVLERDREAEVAFIVSPVPVIHLSEFIANVADLPLLGLADDLRDEWEHESNQKERDRVLDRVFEYSAKARKRVVFLSGDVHVAAAFRMTRGSHPDARVYQLTSSGITFAAAPGRALQLVVREAGTLDHSAGGKPTSFRRLHVFPDNNFGLIHAERRAGGGVDLAWDLYGSTGEPDEIVKLRRVDLPGS